MDIFVFPKKFQTIGHSTAFKSDFSHLIVSRQDLAILLRTTTFWNSIQVVSITCFKCAEGGGWAGAQRKFLLRNMTFYLSVSSLGKPQKSSFFSGPTTQAFSPPPLYLVVIRTFLFVLKQPETDFDNCFSPHFLDEKSQYFQANISRNLFLCKYFKKTVKCCEWSTPTPILVVRPLTKELFCGFPYSIESFRSICILKSAMSVHRKLTRRSSVHACLLQSCYEFVQANSNK